MLCFEVTLQGVSDQVVHEKKTSNDAPVEPNSYESIMSATLYFFAAFSGGASSFFLLAGGDGCVSGGGSSD